MWNDTVGSLIAWTAPSSSSGWIKIRKLRNIVGGHPAERSGAVARITIKNQQLLVTYFDKTRKDNIFERFELKSLIKDYNGEAELILCYLRELLDVAFTKS